MDTTDKVLLTTVTIIFCIVSFTLGFDIGQKNTRKEALLIGHASYITDSDGNQKFTWHRMTEQ